MIAGIGSDSRTFLLEKYIKSRVIYIQNKRKAQKREQSDRKQSYSELFVNADSPGVRIFDISMFSKYSLAGIL